MAAKNEKSDPKSVVPTLKLSLSSLSKAKTPANEASVSIPLFGSLSIKGRVVGGSRRAQVWLRGWKLLNAEGVQEDIPTEILEHLQEELAKWAKDQGKSLVNAPITGIAYAGSNGRVTNGFDNSSFFAGIRGNPEIVKQLKLTPTGYGQAAAAGEGEAGGEGEVTDTPL